ncbi:MAG: hypothetical protein WD850_00380 [Candidatus Spechtbacterales bacterium]
MRRLTRGIKLWHLTPLALVALIGVAAFVWWGQRGFSANDVTVAIEGPSQMETGNSDTFIITVFNNASVALEKGDLILDLPPALSFANEENAQTFHFGEVEAGARERIEVRLTAQGSETQEEILARFDYQPAGSKARFISSARHEIVIGTLDAETELTMPSVVYEQDEIEGTLVVRPNSDFDRFILYGRLIAPEGFELSQVSPAFDHDAVWKLGNVRRGQEVRVTFKGRLNVDVDQASFRVELGKISGLSFVPLRTLERTVNISESPLLLEQRIVGSSVNVVQSGSEVSIAMEVTNRDEQTMEQLVLAASITPVDLIDTDSLRPDTPIAELAAGNVVWSSATAPSFASIPFGQTRSVILTFTVRGNPNQQGQAFTIATSATAQRNGEEVRSHNELSIQIAAYAVLEQTVTHAPNVFVNEGPIPPRVGEQTTYSVSWRIPASVSATRTTRVSAKVPDYVSWISSYSPVGQNIRFIEATNTVEWDIGNMSAGNERSVVFRLGVTPREEHRGQAIPILDSTSFTGVDVATNTFFEKTFSSVTTALPDDPTISESEGRVQ